MKFSAVLRIAIKKGEKGRWDGSLINWNAFSNQPQVGPQHPIWAVLMLFKNVCCFHYVVSIMKPPTMLDKCLTLSDLAQVFISRSNFNDLTSPKQKYFQGLWRQNYHDRLFTMAYSTSDTYSAPEIQVAYSTLNLPEAINPCFISRSISKILSNLK